MCLCFPLLKLDRQKTQSIISLQQACSLTTGVHVEYGAKSGVTHKYVHVSNHPIVLVGDICTCLFFADSCCHK